MRRSQESVGVEFSLVAQTKYPGSVSAIQERHLDAAMQFFPLTLIHLDSRWRSLAWLGICDRCQQELWMVRQAEARTHTLNKLRVDCTDVALVTFKQRNSPPRPSSANTYINPQSTLVLNPQSAPSICQFTLSLLKQTAVPGSNNFVELFFSSAVIPSISSADRDHRDSRAL